MNTDRRIDDPRLSSIDSSIADIRATLLELSKAMVTVARVEERLAASQETAARLQRDIDDLHSTVRSLTLTNESQTASLATRAEGARWVERLIWVAFAAAASWYAGGHPYVADPVEQVSE